MVNHIKRLAKIRARSDRAREKRHQEAMYRARRSLDHRLRGLPDPYGAGNDEH